MLCCYGEVRQMTIMGAGKPGGTVLPPRRDSAGTVSLCLRQIIRGSLKEA
jgi:hypothetical protein